MRSKIVLEELEHATLLGHETLPQVWDAGLVGDRIVQAFVTLDLLPPVAGPKSPGGHWPRTVVEFSDRVAFAGMDSIEKKMRYDAANRTVIIPTAEEIRHMDLVFGWLKELRENDAGMGVVVTLWALRTARGRSIKRLCFEKRWVPRTFWRKREAGLEFLAESLNGRAVPVF